MATASEAKSTFYVESLASKEKVVEVNGGLGLEKPHDLNGEQSTGKEKHPLEKTGNHSLEKEGSSQDESGMVVPTVIVNDRLPSQPRSKLHARDSSISSNQSGMGSPSSADHMSTSSSSIGSRDQYFNSRDAMIEHMRSELYSSASASNSSLRENGAEGENGIVTQLLEHIVSLKMELEKLKEDNKQLHSQRSTMDDELHTLTENLFEEAYKMVDEAKGGKVVAEKKLADAAGKIDAMETEMGVLKTLIHTNDATAVHDKHTLHPSPHHKHHRKPSVKKVLRKIKKVATPKPLTKEKATPTPIALVEHKGDSKGDILSEGEMLPSDYDEFNDWIEKLESCREHPYLRGIVELDVRPCLSFKNKSLSSDVLQAVSENNLLMESLSNGTDERSECALSGSNSSPCTHRLQLGESDQWYYISQQCRDRIAAACDIYMFISYVQKGIIKLESTKLYWQMARLRALMTISRLSLHLPDSH